MLEVLPLFLLASAASARVLVVNPADTIGSAAEMAQPGDIVRIYSGVYRESVVVKQSGTKEKPIRFEAAPGATVVITGADRITAWRPEPGDGKVFSTEWPYPVRRPHPNDDYHLLIGYFTNPNSWGTGIAWTPAQMAAVEGAAPDAGRNPRGAGRLPCG